MTIAIDVGNFCRREGSEKAHIHDIALEWNETFDITLGGIIKTPGKFQGNPVYVPYYLNMAGNGMLDYVVCSKCPSHYFVELDEDEWQRFPELRHFNYLVVWEDDSGFADFHLFVTDKEYLNWQE